jgi:UTP:GlnB (protein PII) uridylyltransferase
MKTLSDVSALDLPVVAVRYARESGCTEIMVFTPDLANLLAITTAGFDNLNLNITWYI